MNDQDWKNEILETQKKLAKFGLAPLNWGNCSFYDRKANKIYIKPSGVLPELMQCSDVVVIDIDGRVLEGDKRPSSDTLTHLEIYKYFEDVNAVIHTHSKFATLFAQAKIPIPCFGTTHADLFHGPVPITRELNTFEVENEYELNTGKVIIEKFKEINLNPLETPGVLVASHGPFTWGVDLDDAFKIAFGLEFIAEMALNNLQMNERLHQITNYILNKHFHRKHGEKAYYGQV